MTNASSGSITSSNPVVYVNTFHKRQLSSDTVPPPLSPHCHTTTSSTHICGDRYCPYSFLEPQLIIFGDRGQLRGHDVHQPRHTEPTRTNRSLPGWTDRGVGPYFQRSLGLLATPANTGCSRLFLGHSFHLMPQTIYSWVFVL